MKINPSIFREYDVRGIAGSELSSEFAKHLGLAFASMISNNQPVAGRSHLKVAVGRDCRLTSDDYAAALAEGLTEGGVDVLMLGTCATPLTYFSIFHHDLDGGIMVTGSHNPANYNGFKMCVGRSTIHGEQIQTLRKVMETFPGAASRKGVITETAIIPDYIDYVASNIHPQKKLKVVLDAGNGTAATIAPPLFNKLGAEIVELYCELDGRFPNHHPDPTVHENLTDLVNKIRETHADFGVAFDGDSDRVGLVDEKGRIVFGDELMIILSREVLSSNPGATIISEVKSSHRLYQDIEAKGGKPLMWKTGHSLIKSKMKETQAALAGEMSGHIFFADRYFGFDDAIYAAARIYEIATKTAGPVSSLIEDLEPMVATPEIRVDCEESKKFQLVEETKKRLLGNSEYKINDIDGVRVDYPDAWGLVRASNTQPVLVLRFEAPTEARLKEVRSHVENALKDAASSIGHGPIL